MSLPRQKLYERIKWGLDRQFADVIDDPVGYKIYKICDYLWRMIIFDDPASKAWKRGPRDNWNPAVLPPEKSLFTQEPGYGVVIGNLTSQLVSNIYLGQLDRFIYFDLGYKYYGRYVDDFYIMVPEEQYAQAKEDVAVIEKYLREELGLIMHKKKRYYQNVKKGMSFLGARVYPHCLYPSDRLQKNFRRAALEMTQGFKNIETIVSYMGIMTHLDASNYIRTVFEEMGWDFRI